MPSNKEDFVNLEYLLYYSEFRELNQQYLFVSTIIKNIARIEGLARRTS